MIKNTDLSFFLKKKKRERKTQFSNKCWLTASDVTWNEMPRLWYLNFVLIYSLLDLYCTYIAIWKKNGFPLSLSEKFNSFSTHRTAREEEDTVTIQSFIHSFNKYLLSTHYVQSITFSILFFYNLQSKEETDIKQTKLLAKCIIIKC